MSDDQTTGGVRRFGRRDRKRSLDPRGPLFPPDELNDEVNTTEAEVDATPVELPSSQSEKPASIIKEPVIPIPARTQSKVTRGAPSGKSVLANLLTVLFLLGTVGLIGLIGIITANPNTPLNPFPPFTPLPIIITATFLPPTETPQGTLVPTATFTPLAVDTSSTGSTELRFALANEQPVYAPNANNKGCDWSSIAGTVTDDKGKALDGYRVHVKGNGIEETVFSGAALTFGAGGFELFLSGAPQAQTYSVQLLDPQSKPLSSAYEVVTKASCDQNVAVLQFIQKP